MFDSGVGGLTVVAALRELLPAEDIFYIGDTARVPYGGKSRSTIERYSQELSAELLAEGAKMIVVACNTASALAVPTLIEELDVPVIGVIVPGAKAAVKATRNKKVAVIGTRATIHSRAYERAIRELSPRIKVTGKACPLFVPLIEEGWAEHNVALAVIDRYLKPIIESGVDTMVLGCTHYPLLAETIRSYVGPGIKLVNSARNTALEVQKLLARKNLAAPLTQRGRLRVALTDQSDHFLQVAKRALNLRIGKVEVRKIKPLAL